MPWAWVRTPVVSACEYTWFSVSILSPVAQTLTDLGVSFRGLVTKRNLKRALDYCISRQPQQSGHRGNGG